MTETDVNPIGSGCPASIGTPARVMAFGNTASRRTLPAPRPTSRAHAVRRTTMPPAGRMPKRSAQRFRSADTMLTAGKRDRAVPATSVHHRPAPEVDAHVWCPPCPGWVWGSSRPGSPEVTAESLRSCPSPPADDEGGQGEHGGEHGDGDGRSGPGAEAVMEARAVTGGEWDGSAGAAVNIISAVLPGTLGHLGLGWRSGQGPRRTRSGIPGSRTTRCGPPSSGAGRWARPASGTPGRWAGW